MDKILKFKIELTADEVAGISNFHLMTWLYDKLIEQNNIDTDFYLVRIDSIKMAEKPNSFCKDIYATYYLVRRKIWEDLEELIERLKIGL